jgi:hypothetical protein
MTKGLEAPKPPGSEGAFEKPLFTKPRQEVPVCVRFRGAAVNEKTIEGV